MRAKTLMILAAVAILAFAIAGCQHMRENSPRRKPATNRPDRNMPQLAALRNEAGEYVLPDLPYDYDALEPVISSEVMELHHSKHHAGYVNGLNSALKRLEEARAKADYAAISEISQLLAFNGSGHLNHTLFWQIMTPGGADLDADGPLMEAIKRDFGSFDAFTAQFKAVSNSVRGSGWAMLVWEPVGEKLMIIRVLNHEDQTISGVIPILNLDVWEHAYYLDYQNRRGEYVEGFMTIINWPEVERQFLKAIGE